MSNRAPRPIIAAGGACKVSTIPAQGSLLTSQPSSPCRATLKRECRKVRHRRPRNVDTRHTTSERTNHVSLAIIRRAKILKDVRACSVAFLDRSVRLPKVVPVSRDLRARFSARNAVPFSIPPSSVRPSSAKSKDRTPLVARGGGTSYQSNVRLHAQAQSHRAGCFGKYAAPVMW